MTKAKQKAAPVIGATFYFGQDALKSGFEKTTAFCDTFQEFSKDTGEAYMESAMVAGAGIQSINNEIYAYSQKAASDALAATKAVMAAKTIPELFALQTKLAKSAFDGYVAQATKFGELYKSVAKNSFAPLEARALAVGELVSETVRA
jgi:phasin family protein